MPIRTGSILERLCADVDKHKGRVARASRRVEGLRAQYQAAADQDKRHIAGKGFKAREALAKAETDLRAAEAALQAEETRLLQPDSFLRFA